MSRVIGPALSAALVERLSQRDLARRLGIGLPFVTQDAEGRLHPMLVSYLEVRAYDTRTLGLVIQARSSSARNLAERGVGTLSIIEPDAVVYVKIRAVDGPLPVVGDPGAGLGFFPLQVAHRVQRRAVERDDHVVFPHAALIGRLARHHAAYQHALGLAQLQPIDVVVADVGDRDAQ